MSQPVQYAAKNLAQVKVDPMRTLSRALLFVGIACSCWLVGLLVDFWERLAAYRGLPDLVINYSLSLAFFVFLVLAIINLTRIQKPRPTFISCAVFFARLLTCVLILLSILMSVGPNFIQWLVYTACLFIEPLQPAANVLITIALFMPAVVTFLLIILMSVLFHWKLVEINLKTGRIEARMLIFAILACDVWLILAMFIPLPLSQSPFYGVPLGIVCLWLISYCFRMWRFLNLQRKV